jgi:GTPase SAR1 family protein
MFLKHKIVFLGDQAVGKTSIILRFSQETYDGKQKVSISLKTTNITKY